MKDLSKFILESKTRTNNVTLKKFIEWYGGEKINKITKDFIEDPLGWDYLKDDLNMSLDEIIKLFNDNLNNKFDFNQKDTGRAILISWTMGNKEFEVESTDWYGEKYGEKI